MKKAQLLLASLILLFISSSLWAVWEGNAGVGSSSSFPDSGMYVLSDIFPDNTIVYIQNLETGLSARAVVAGKAGVAGIIASVSPEVAETLNIESGSVTRVRISIPPEIPETAVSDFSDFSPDSIDSSDPDLNPAAMVAMQGASMTSPAASAAAGGIAQATEVEEAIARQSEPVHIAEVYDEPSLLVAPKDAPVPEIASLNEKYGASDASDDHKVESVPALPEKARAGLPAKKDLEVAEVALVPAAMNPPQASGGTLEREVPEVPPLAPSLEEPSRPQEELVPEVAPIMLSKDSFLLAEEEAYVEEVAAIDYAKPDSFSEEESVAIVPPVIAAIEEEAATPVEETETEIALEPVETYTTEYIYIPPEDFAEDATVEEIAAIEPLPLDEEPPITEVATIEPEAPPRNAPLEQGYYVQIGSYLDSANVKRLMDSYSGKYPLAFVDAPSRGAGPATKRALVGRLNPDETGAVLEFFRSEGFKDAFVFVVN